MIPEDIYEQMIVYIFLSFRDEDVRLGLSLCFIVSCPNPQMSKVDHFDGLILFCQGEESKNEEPE